MKYICYIFFQCCVFASLGQTSYQSIQTQLLEAQERMYTNTAKAMQIAQDVAQLSDQT